MNYVDCQKDDDKRLPVNEQFKQVEINLLQSRSSSGLQLERVRRLLVVVCAHE